jgi:GAF domain-containing protein
VDLPIDLQADLSRLSGQLVTETADLAKLQATADILRRSIPRCDSASIALLVEDTALTGVTTSHLALEADLVQYRHDEGPCLSAARLRSPVRIDVLRSEERFVHFAPGAIALGVESVLSLPLLSEEVAVGSVNLYSTTSGAFADPPRAALEPMLAYAADVIARSPLYAASIDLVERLVDVAEEATVVDIALGRLVRTWQLDGEEAWRYLRDAADLDGSLVASARRVIATVHPAEDDAVG